MTQAEYLTRLHAPVRVLDMRVPRRARSARGVDMRAERAAALVEARVKCECANTQDDARVERILRVYHAQLDIQAKRDAQEQRDDARDDLRVSRIVSVYVHKLDTKYRCEQRKAQVVDRKRRYREYLNRCAARARAQYAAAYRANRVRSAQPDQRTDDTECTYRGHSLPRKPEYLSQPGPLVRVGPATQVSCKAQPSQPKPSTQPTLTYRMSAKLRRALVAFEAAMPEPEQILTAHDYTSPVRDGVQLSSLEEHHMDRDDMAGLDDAQRHEVQAYQGGVNSLYLPTHASMQANATCGCGDDGTYCEYSSEPTCYAPYVGAEPGSLRPSRLSQGTSAELCVPEVRF